MLFRLQRNDRITKAAPLVLALLIIVLLQSDFSLLSMAPPCNSKSKSSSIIRNSNNILEVAICVMVTSSSTLGPTDLAGTLDGAAALRTSVLQAYNLTSAVHEVKLNRTVGLPPYNRNHTNSTLWMKPKNEIVSAYEFDLDGKTTVRLRFISHVNFDVEERWQRVLQDHQYEVWRTRTPMEHTEVRNEELQRDIVTSGAIGISELIKLDGLRMNDFDSVLFVDCDVIFHKRFDELILMEENFGWTHGGWPEERINGGFLVYSPKHPASRHHFDQMIGILREGNFSGSGWRKSGIGWTYGGQTVQGILPYYYFIEANKEQEGLAQKLGIKMAAAHREIDRCRYNNMVQLDKCKNIPFDSVVSNHFTGDCGKPWHCPPKTNQLCNRFRIEFMKRYKETVLSLAQFHPLLTNSSGAVEFVNSLNEGEWCVDEKFVSVSAMLRLLA